MTVAEARVIATTRRDQVLTWPRQHRKVKTNQFIRHKAFQAPRLT